MSSNLRVGLHVLDLDDECVDDELGALIPKDYLSKHRFIGLEVAMDLGQFSVIPAFAVKPFIGKAELGDPREGNLIPADPAPHLREANGKFGAVVGNIESNCIDDSEPSVIVLVDQAHRNPRVAQRSFRPRVI